MPPWNKQRCGQHASIRHDVSWRMEACWLLSHLYGTSLLKLLVAAYLPFKINDHRRTDWQREREREILLPVMAASRVANTKRMQIFILLQQPLVDFLPLALGYDWYPAGVETVYIPFAPPCLSQQQSCALRIGKIKKKKKNTTTLFSTRALWFHFGTFTCAVMRRWVKGQTRGLADTLEMSDHSDESPSVLLGATSPLFHSPWIHWISSNDKRSKYENQL